MEDSWDSGGKYENFMGRWSRQAARLFVDWLSPSPGCVWLDIGCGTGALSEAIVDICRPEKVTAIDQSTAYVSDAKMRLGNRVEFKVGDALAIPVPDASVDFVVSGLVLNFISEPVPALGQMKRVIKPGGTIAAYVWDYSGKMEFLRKFWDMAVALDPAASALDEGRRFPNSTAEALTGLFDSAGIVDIESGPINIETPFRDFDDYWKPFLGGQGPAPTYLMSLDEDERKIFRDRLRESLPVQKDGSILLGARAWAVRGRRADSG